MPSFKDKRVLPYTAEFINELILDVESYPNFLPWCKNATILSKSENEITAQLTIHFKGLSESYTSLITTSQDAERFTISVKAISGPFKTLTNLWNIEKLNKKCEVSFFIDFEFKSRIINAIIGALFSVATEKMIHAFEKRADDLSKV